MSAIPPIATAKADLRKQSCLLYPRKRTCTVQNRMSATGHKQTLVSLFEHLVGPINQRVRNVEAHRLGGLEADNQLDLAWLLYWKIARLPALQYFVHVAGRAAKQVGKSRAVGGKTARRNKFGFGIYAR